MIACVPSHRTLVRIKAVVAVAAGIGADVVDGALRTSRERLAFDFAGLAGVRNRVKRRIRVDQESRKAARAVLRGISGIEYGLCVV
jgi:hypothetical protein